LLREFRLARESAQLRAGGGIPRELGRRIDSDERLLVWWHGGSGSSGRGDPSAWRWGDFVSPLYRTKIGDYELSRAINHSRSETLSIAAMVHEHLVGLQEFLPPLYESEGDYLQLLQSIG